MTRLVWVLKLFARSDVHGGIIEAIIREGHAPGPATRHAYRPLILN
jgi:hypothetical protein